MRCLVAFVLLAGTANAEMLEWGRLENPALTEASGLARSQLDDDRFWVINDGGHGPYLYAINSFGDDLGVVEVPGARNWDWEDIASFTLDGQAMLLIADIGDNLGIRTHLVLYIVDEPQPADEYVRIRWQLDVALEDGAADAEAIAVDSAGGLILLLTKRRIPAVLYELPLAQPGVRSSTIVAQRRGDVSSLPQPTDDDIANALLKLDWHWQPTGMDISPDGNVAVILTYRAIYLFRREDSGDWHKIMNTAPTVIALGDFREAESVAFSRDGRSVFVTSEQRNAPLLKIDVRSPESNE